MDRRFEARKQELLDDCQVSPEVFAGMMSRLEEFAEPFTDRLVRIEQMDYARTYVSGLLSNLDRKNSEAIAYRHDQDRMGLQLFIGCSPWDHQPLLAELALQVGREIGESDGVISFDPSAFPKKGKMSAGVQRQWCGRLGKIDNCQVGIFMSYASREEQALVNAQLYLPKELAKDKAHRKACGIPKDARYQTRRQLALQMLAEAGGSLPHAWVTGDDEMGRPYRFRRDLNERGEQYLLAVPSNTSVRDLEADPPAYRGCGSRPKAPFQQVSQWCAALPQAAWTRIEVRKGEKGPLNVEVTKRRVSARTDRRRIAPPETLVVIRWRDEENTLKTDYYLSNASPETPLAEFARVSKAHTRIEQCLQRSKSEAGLAQYQVRSWNGWHHHITLSLIATWFLVQESRRGKKMDTGHHGPAGPRRPLSAAAPSLRLRHARTDRKRTHSLAGTQ